MLTPNPREPTIVQPLSIALVTDWCPPRVGGVERHVAGLAHALAARGHTVHLFTTTRQASALAGVRIHEVRAAMVGDVAAPALWRVDELRAMLVGAGVDLVHAHGMFSTLGIGGLLAANRAGIPGITTHHSLLRRSPTLPAAWLTYRLFSHRATLVTAVSAAAADDARRASGRADVPLLPNGLDRARWTVGLRPDGGIGAAAGSKRPSGAIRVVSVMRLASKKSPGDLVAAVPMVLARVKRAVMFTIVGDGPERPRLERQARRLGVAQQVEFLGICSASRVAEVLARSDLFALPSRREAFGIALLEARAAALPVVARASGGIPEVVHHGRQGLLTNTVPEFADAIAALVSDDGLRRRFSLAASDGLDLYDWDRVVDRHEVVYRHALIAKRGNG